MVVYLRFSEVVSFSSDGDYWFILLKGVDFVDVLVASTVVTVFKLVVIDLLHVRDLLDGLSTGWFLTGRQHILDVALDPRSLLGIARLMVKVDGSSNSSRILDGLHVVVSFAFDEEFWLLLRFGLSRPILGVTDSGVYHLVPLVDPVEVHAWSEIDVIKVFVGVRAVDVAFNSLKNGVMDDDKGPQVFVEMPHKSLWFVITKMIGNDMFSVEHQLSVGKIQLEALTCIVALSLREGFEPIDSLRFEAHEETVLVYGEEISDVFLEETYNLRLPLRSCMGDVFDIIQASDVANPFVDLFEPRRVSMGTRFCYGLGLICFGNQELEGGFLAPTMVEVEDFKSYSSVLGTSSKSCTVTGVVLTADWAELLAWNFGFQVKKGFLRCDLAVKWVSVKCGEHRTSCAENRGIETRAEAVEHRDEVALVHKMLGFLCSKSRRIS